MYNIFRHIKESQYTLPFILLIPFVPVLAESIVISLDDISSYYQLYYFIGYEYGFGGRKLLGTIFSPLLPEYVGHRQLLPIIWGINLIFLVLFVLFLSKIIKRANEIGIGWGVIAVIAFWLVSPFSILKYLNHGINLMFPEIWSMVLSISFLFLHKFAHNRWWYYVLTLLFCIIGCLIHHVFCCLFFPLFLAIFANDILSSNQEESRKKIMIYGIICLILTITFLSIWLFSNMNTDIKSVHETICHRTTPGVCTHDKDAINQMYYLSNSDNTINQAGNFHIRFIELLLTFFALSPLIAILIVPWILAIKNSLETKSKWKYLLVGSIPTIIHAPIYFFAIDYGRWEYAWFFNYVCLLLFFVWNDDASIIEAIYKMIKWILHHPILSLCTFVYLAALPASTAWDIPFIHQLAGIILR